MIPGATSPAGASHIYVDDGTYPIGVVVADSDGETAQASAAVKCPNEAPTVDAGDDATIDEGSAFSGAASFTDPGTIDNHTLTVDYGDGSGAQPLPGQWQPLPHVCR